MMTNLYTFVLSNGQEFQLFINGWTRKMFPKINFSLEKISVKCDNDTFFFFQHYQPFPYYPDDSSDDDDYCDQNGSSERA